MIPAYNPNNLRENYWKIQARELAWKNHEYCPCWDAGIDLKFSEDGRNYIHLNCIETVTGCPSTFRRTEIELSKLFRKFYNIPLVTRNDP